MTQAAADRPQLTGAAGAAEPSARPESKSGLALVYTGGAIYVAVALWALLIPLTSGVVKPVYEEFAVELPAGTTSILSIPTVVLIFAGSAVPLIGVCLTRALLRGRAAVWAIGLILAGVGFGGIIAMAMLILPLGGLVAQQSP